MEDKDLKDSSGNPQEARGGRQPFQVSQEPVIFGEHPEVIHVPEPLSPFDDLGELPASYGTKFVFLVARDPYWLFAYWDFSWADIPEASTGTARLKVYKSDGALESDIDLTRDASNWYIPVKQASTEYYIDLGIATASGEWVVVARSGLVATPSDKLADFGESQFATLPFHLGFQKLVDGIKQAMAEGESLVQALSRLQEEIGIPSLLTGKSSDWTDEQRAILETLLGKETIEALLAGSGQIDELLRKYLDEGLSSQSGSESSLRERFAEILGVPESSLFSGIGASWFGRESVAGSETVGGSWQLGSSASWETGFGGSWQVGAAAAWQQALSSWGVVVGGSWQSGLKSSWETGVGSSWETGLTTSWSTGLGSSWSAQPFSTQERNFFMHVNAEVIFYGGTDPNATVWIDGKRVQLQKDGTFHYHFVFPDKDYEIPIVAQSPDGLEFRSAKLHFSRRTERQGDVRATGQPPLGEPMGGK